MLTKRSIRAAAAPQSWPRSWGQKPTEACSPLHVSAQVEAFEIFCSMQPFCAPRWVSMPAEWLYDCISHGEARFLAVIQNGKQAAVLVPPLEG